MLKSRNYQKKLSPDSYDLAYTLCRITYSCVSLEACTNFQHQYPVLDCSPLHTKQATQCWQVFLGMSKALLLYTEQLLHTFLHVLHN